MRFFIPILILLSLAFSVVAQPITIVKARQFADLSGSAPLTDTIHIIDTKTQNLILAYLHSARPLSRPRSIEARAQLFHADTLYTIGSAFQIMVGPHCHTLPTDNLPTLLSMLDALTTDTLSFQQSAYYQSPPVLTIPQLHQLSLTSNSSFLVDTVYVALQSWLPAQAAVYQLSVYYGHHLLERTVLRNRHSSPPFTSPVAYAELYIQSLSSTTWQLSAWLGGPGYISLTATLSNGRFSITTITHIP